MDFTLLNRFKNNQSKWIYPLLYLAIALLLAAAICYLIFAFKVYLLHQKISELNSKLALYGTPKEKLAESKFLTYKKKIDYFGTLIGSHKTSLRLFSFLEEKTLPDVWFSSIDVLLAKQEVTLSGESATMEAVSRQVKLFEESADYVKSVAVLSSKMGDQGKAQFTVSLSLHPAMFAYPK